MISLLPSKKHQNIKNVKNASIQQLTFTPESNDVPAYQPPEAQSIKEMLAEVKHNVHHADMKTNLISILAKRRIQ